MDTREPISHAELDDEISEAAPTPNNTPPFDEIALTLSGGGYRAGAFHLGTLDMLQRLDLLNSVHVLSTVSGGTLTGLKYALSAAEGATFEKFYSEFYGFLLSTNVIKKGLAGLHPQSQSPFSNQMPSLIRSAADAYTAPQMLSNKTFGVLLNGGSSHLREASFNATDFRTGNYFRFQRSESSRAHIGNGRLSIRRDVAELIRLADIAAASSCFPSAFEPFRFPDDFLWPKPMDEIRNGLGENFAQCVPLMDGGIYDNQGVDSVVRAYERGNRQIGLLIISDTTQRVPSLLEFTPEPKRGWLTVGNAVKLAWLVFFVAVTTAIILITLAARSILTYGLSLLDFFLYFVPIILSLVLAGGLWWVRRQYQDGQKRVEEMTTIELWPFLKNLSVPELIYLISGRAKSLVALTSSVFLRRVRLMVYKDIKVHPSYRDRQFSNLIYDLDDTGKFLDDIVKELGPEQFSDLSRKAEGVATSLWANNEDELKDLIACGQVTTCFNILRYILTQRKHGTGMQSVRDEEIYRRALGLWNELKKNRYAFLRAV